MRVNEFPGCCGASVLYDLNGGPLGHYIGHYNTRSYIVAITNPAQTKAIASLKKEGFKALDTFHNNNSGSNLTLWGRTKAAPVKVAKRKFNKTSALVALKDLEYALGD